MERRFFIVFLSLLPSLVLGAAGTVRQLSIRQKPAIVQPLNISVSVVDDPCRKIDSWEYEADLDDWDGYRL